MVNFAKTISDEWADDGILVNVINPQRMMTPMRLKAFGEEPVVTLLSPGIVAKKSISTILQKRKFFKQHGEATFGKYRIKNVESGKFAFN